MGIKFGEIDSTQILDNEYRSKLVEKLVMWLFANNATVIKTPSNEEFQKIQEEVLRELQRKYPNSGVKLQE